MSEQGTEALMELGRAILEATRENTAAVRDLRSDLKRREARDLESAGRIPAVSSARASSGKGSGSGDVFPNYGRGKNQPIRGAAMSELEYYASGCERTLADPAKARFHDRERALLATIHAEMARQGGAPDRQVDPSPPPDFGPGDDIPF